MDASRARPPTHSHPPAAPIQVDGLGAGQPLAPAIQANFEARLAMDLGAVRVHIDEPTATAMRARAFAAGNHVVFGPGEYDPGSKGGRRLLAHELVHVRQQANAGSRSPGVPLLQREPLDGGSSTLTSDFEELDPSDLTCSAPPAESVSTAASPDQASTPGPTGPLEGFLPALTDQEQERLRILLGSTRLYRLIQQKQSMGRGFAHEERRGMGIIRHTAPNQAVTQRVQQEIDAELQRLGVPDERALLQLVEVTLPSMVLARAKQIGLAMLARNEALAKAEMARYAELVCSPDIEGLLDADRELGNRHSEMRSLQLSIEQATRYMSNIPAGIPTTPEEYGIPPGEESVMVVIQNIDSYRAQLELQKAEYDHVIKQYATRYPILLALGYEPGAFSFAPREDLGRLTAEPLQDILDNIEDVREAVEDDELKVWNMRDVIELAILDLKIGDQPHLLGPVENRIRQEQEDEAFRKKVKVALALITTIAAGILLPGWGAMAVGALWGGSFLAESLGEYRRETAAENVSMDPEVRDISINEPELLWVVLDVVGLGLDLGAIVRTLRPLARAAIRSRRVVEFQEAVRRLRGLPSATADRLVNSLRRRLGREAIEEGGAAAGAARAALGEGKTLDEYLAALRSESHPGGTVGRSWDYQHQPIGLPESKWRPGDPIDMPNTRGTYPTYDTARQRYWRNRAQFELDARARGQATHRPGATTDPVAGLDEAQLRQMMDSGKAPEYRFAARPGQTWELEHHGVPQRVVGWLNELGFSTGDSRRLAQVSHPGSLMEVTPLEHAFFDAQAWGFGSLRADVAGARWAGTVAADIRGARPLYSMSDQTIIEILQTAQARRFNFGATTRTRELRDALRREIAERGLSIAPP